MNKTSGRFRILWCLNKLYFSPIVLWASGVISDQYKETNRLLLGVFEIGSNNSLFGIHFTSLQRHFSNWKSTSKKYLKTPLKRKMSIGSLWKLLGWGTSKSRVSINRIWFTRRGKYLSWRWTNSIELIWLTGSPKFTTRSKGLSKRLSTYVSQLLTTWSSLNRSISSTCTALVPLPSS